MTKAVSNFSAFTAVKTVASSCANNAFYGTAIAVLFFVLVLTFAALLPNALLLLGALLSLVICKSR